MTRKFEKIYQFKITLNDVRPLIWRRIQVPDHYTFWDLHVAIQDAMGWLDCHLHQFELMNPVYGELDVIGIPDDGWLFERTLPGWEIPIRYYFTLDNTKAIYDYDFGDGWRHSVVLERIIPANPAIEYPVCVTGKRACPPEDCGGPFGYESLLRIISNPTHEEHKNVMEWLGGEFHPEAFYTHNVKFDNPDDRLKMAINDL